MLVTEVFVRASFMIITCKSCHSLPHHLMYKYEYKSKAAGVYCGFLTGIIFTANYILYFHLTCTLIIF